MKESFAVGLIAGAHWDLSPKVSINGNGELVGAHNGLFGASVSTAYQISKVFSATGGVGVQWLGFKSPEVDCTDLEVSPPDPQSADANNAANFIPVGFLEAALRWHFAGDPPNASGWFGALVRGGMGLDQPRDLLADDGSSSYVESPPGVSFYGLFGSNF